MAHLGFDNWANPFKEVRLQARFIPMKLGGVREYGTLLAGLRIGVPEQVLLNGYRSPMRQGAIDAVKPLSVIGIAVMGIGDRT